MPPSMIDLHLHLLPSIDDGAHDLDVSVAMIALARHLGFTRLVATPHLSGPLPSSYSERIRSAHAQLRDRLAEGDPTVDLGFEIQIFPGLPDQLAGGAALTLAGSTTVLTEVPFSGWPHHADNTFFELQSAGYRVVLAHPERYGALQDRPEKAFELAERGIMLQVTFGSLAGLFGKPAQRIAEALLAENAVSILASDAHSAGHRFVSVAEGKQRALDLVGPDRFDQLTRHNPAALLSDAPLPDAHPVAGIAPRATNGLRRLLGKSGPRRS